MSGISFKDDRVHNVHCLSGNDQRVMYYFGGGAVVVAVHVAVAHCALPCPLLSGMLALLAVAVAPCVLVSHVVVSSLPHILHTYTCLRQYVHTSRMDLP